MMLAIVAAVLGLLFMSYHYVPFNTIFRKLFNFDEEVHDEF